MDYAMNELEQEVLNATRELAQKKLKPLRAEMDAKEEFSHEMLEEYRKSGMFGLWLPEKYGGLGGGLPAWLWRLKSFPACVRGWRLRRVLRHWALSPCFWPLRPNSANAGAMIWLPAKSCGPLP